MQTSGPCGAAPGRRVLHRARLAQQTPVVRRELLPAQGYVVQIVDHILEGVTGWVGQARLKVLQAPRRLQRVVRPAPGGVPLRATQGSGG